MWDSHCREEAIDRQMRICRSVGSTHPTVHVETIMRIFVGMGLVGKPAGRERAEEARMTFEGDDGEPGLARLCTISQDLHSTADVASKEEKVVLLCDAQRYDDTMALGVWFIEGENVRFPSLIYFTLTH